MVESGVAAQVARDLKKVGGFFKKAWDSPVGKAVGIAAFAIMTVALAATAPLSIPALALILGTAATVGMVANILVGAVDAGIGAVTGKSSKDYVSSELDNNLTMARDVLFTIGAVAEGVGLLYGLGRLGLTLAAYGKPTKFRAALFNPSVSWKIGQRKAALQSHFQNIKAIFKYNDYDGMRNFFRYDYWNDIRWHWHPRPSRFKRW